ncbi:Rieske 2Fe-2S domain-containing protein [Actinopolymorpha pittospori]|uniref:Cytochrome bc1 complex Rieske iron-sulfur subunit n=1 Tax=Actinopolymorpha pittospori TaxID=648752 RepID=A0A927N1T5_9ACTN|nr:Rieske Fe-S protein [Actinopolymorpha pittospori]
METSKRDTPENLGPLTRRRVLSGVAAVGATVPLLAACGGSDTGAGSGDTTTTTDDSSPTQTPNDAAAPGDDATKGGGGDALATTSQVPVNGGMVFKDQKVVVTQPSAGTFKAFSAVCTHMGCTVAGVQDGTINCPCHGSMFSAADGSVKGGPATKPLAAVKIQVDGDSIKLA